ncbi:MAG TPA: mechanosensitive ion channel family protein [Bryobacteraceae bacterium]|jgi:small-conductance mechanosensitive channel|nr:mechanosensitive ion channel family protein [Bryobacteraceae bacterium]
MIAAHTRFQTLRWTTLSVLLAIVLLALFLTRDIAPDQAVASRSQSAPANPIDDSLLNTAHRLSMTATSSDEQSFAQQAIALSDHELDQSFQSAIRAALAQSAPLKGPLKVLADRVSRLKARVTKEQDQVAGLTKQAAKDQSVNDQLEVAQAQLALHQDELSDAEGDLAREGGDRHAALQQALQQHQAAHASMEQFPKIAETAPPAILWDRVQLAENLGGRREQVRKAAAEASQHSDQLDRQHDGMQRQMASKDAPAAAESMTAAVARLHDLSNQTKTLSELDKRMQDSRQLAQVYGQWADSLGVRERSVWHLVFISLLQILAIVLAVFLIDGALPHRFGRERSDGRRLQQLQSIAKIAFRVLGGGLILIIVFGLPSQTSTLIGLATAGLTVVLKDFIVGFFGWFVLIGSNGIHVGDWVEIEGVGGEVIDIGLLRTVLLEIGNSTGAGHPTGRRVSFVNSFAIEGHYFNFSTNGQWLWDEIQVSLAFAEDPYKMADLIGKRIEAETEDDAKMASQEWERVTHQYGLRPFSLKPAVDLRPSATGIEMVVRYITRAPQRYEVKARLSQAIVELLHKQAPTATAQLA